MVTYLKVLDKSTNTVHDFITGFADDDSKESYTAIKPITFDGGNISSSSFNFTKMTTNMYEAGVRGLFYEIAVWGQGVYKYDFLPTYVGFPSLTKDNRKYTPGQAARITAIAFQLSITSLALRYQAYSPEGIAALSRSDVQNQFNETATFILSAEIMAGATVGVRKNGQNTITKDAVWGY